MSKNVVSGYPVLYDVPYSMGNHFEQIAPGCFDKADFSEIRLLREHNPSLLLARIGTPTLTVKTDAKGLFFRATLPDTELGFETAKLMNEGVLTQLSWGWAGTVDRWSTYKGKQLRIIVAVRTLYDVSICTYPANPATFVQLDAPIFTSTTTGKAPVFTTTTTTSKDPAAQRAKAPTFDAFEENFLFVQMIHLGTPEACRAYRNYSDSFSLTNN